MNNPSKKGCTQVQCLRYPRLELSFTFPADLAEEQGRGLPDPIAAYVDSVYVMV